MQKRTIAQILRSIDWANITPATYVRYILMVITIINTILTRSGLNPIPVSEDGLYQIVSDVLTVAVMISNTWCNNSVTTNAIAADRYMDRLNVTDGNVDE